MGVPKTSAHIQIKVRMQNPSQEPPASSKAPNQDLKDMDDLCTFKIKIGSWNLEYECIKDWWPCLNQDQDAKPQSGTSNIIQIQRSGLKGHVCSLHLQHPDREQKIVSWVYQRPVTISKQDQYAKSQPGSSSILQSPKWLKGHGCSLHLKNQDREPQIFSFLNKAV